MASTDTSTRSAWKREAGGGCPSAPCCTHSSTWCDSFDASCSSCCPPRCGHSQADCQPCAPGPLKSILKKRSCCRPPSTPGCLCQPTPRGCNCPPPVHVDARATRDCSCACPSSPECACPPSERRFPRTGVKCANARICCPFPRPQPKCCCARCQPCPPPPPPPPCDPCTSKCRGPPKESCRPCPPPSCPSCVPCRPMTPCRKLTFCSQRGRPTSCCTGTGQSPIGNVNWPNGVHSERDNIEELAHYNPEDCHGSLHSCPCAHCCTGHEHGHEHSKIDKASDPILEKSSHPKSGKNPNPISDDIAKDSTSKDLIDLSEAAKSVDSDLHGAKSEKETEFPRKAETSME